MNETLKDILVAFCIFALIFIFSCNFIGILAGSQTSCDSERLIARNWITGAGYKATCSDKAKFSEINFNQ